MNLQAVLTLAGLEVRQRVRSTRWRVTLGILFALMSLIVFGSLYVVVSTDSTFDDWSVYAFEIVLFVILFVGLVGAPTISATSINGDRRDATLAVVQATPISAWELTLGKFLGAWVASLALVGVALPYLVFGIVIGPTSVIASVGAIVVLALLLGCYCAIGLGFSAATSRPAASAMLTQATVLLLLIGLPLAFVLTVPAVTSSEKVTVTEWDYGGAASVSTCREVPGTREFTHTEYTWWLLAPNPLVVVGDVVGAGQHRDSDETRGLLRALSHGMSATRTGPEIVGSTCPTSTDDRFNDVVLYDDRDSGYVGHTWYIGLGITMAIGAFGLWVAARRLRVPAGKLARGVRVA
ncbi:ABC transporter permease [Gordonia malaquae]|uniref:ABC transporter permease n=1 Tax=Gordonia malaquae TaxID=410332 RepID=UPI0030FE068B